MHAAAAAVGSGAAAVIHGAAAAVLSLPVPVLVLLAVVLDAVLISVLGGLKLFRAQCLLANATIVLPCNIFMPVAYWLLTPLRLVYGQFLNMELTKICSRGKTSPGFWQATFDGFLDSVIIIYHMCIGDRNVLDLPFKTVYDAVHHYVDTDPQWLKMASYAHKIPRVVTNSVVFRLIFAVTSQPLLSWWLVGPCNIPFLTPPAAGSDATAPTVRVAIPQCSFLTRAKAHYGEDKGVAACLNECKTSLEVMVGYSMLQGNWQVQPNLEDGSCQMCMNALPAKKCGAGLPDLEELA